MRGRRNRLSGRCHQVQMMMGSQSDTYIPISFLSLLFLASQKFVFSSMSFIITLMHSTNIMHYKYPLCLKPENQKGITIHSGGLLLAPLLLLALLSPSGFTHK